MASGSQWREEFDQKYEMLLDHRLGSGSFGQVVVGVDRQIGQATRRRRTLNIYVWRARILSEACAVKSVKWQAYDKAEEDWDREVGLCSEWMKDRHPNILEVLGVWAQPASTRLLKCNSKTSVALIVSELCHGSLQK